MYYNVNVDQLATCGSLPIQVSTDPGLCTASPSLQGCIPNADYSCNPVAGTALAAGSHEVICSGDDGRGNETHYFQVEVVDNEPPSFVAPPNIQESTCEFFARVHFNVEAVDNCAVVTSCTPPSGSVFAFGNTTVQCTATDPSGNMATSSFQVSVGRETEPPVFTAHPDIVTNTCSSFAQVTFQVEAKDNCGDVIPTCGPASGSLFPVGSTEVHCTAADLSNMSFFVNVSGDSTPPTLHPLADVEADSGCSNSAQVFFTATATDECGAVETTCTPPSGSLFPLGNTSVQCTATDPSGNMATSNFQVTVKGDDTELPSFGEHPDVYAEASDCKGKKGSGAKSSSHLARVFFDVPVTGGCGLETECVPPSGSLFELGRTTVMCMATSQAGSTNTSFQVIVGCSSDPDRRRRKYNKDRDD